MSIHLRPRDPKSRTAAAEMFAPSARKIVAATAAATTDLQAVMSRNARYPADPITALSALVSFRESQAAVDAAQAEYLAWLCVSGVTRSALATRLGVRPQTVAKMLAPVAHLASARSGDLHRDAGSGLWTVHRIDAPLESLEVLS